MIRHVALLTFKPGTTPEQITGLETALRALRTPGLIRLTFGRDLGLMAGRTPGDITFAIVADLEDTAAFHRYDTDPDHQRLRKEHTQRMTQSAARAQYEF
jgi:DNA-binding IscR family transcriptional regulator